MKIYNLLTLLALLLVFTTPLVTYGADGQIKLTQPLSQTDFPITINKAGSYVLTSNLKVDNQDVNAIEITVNDVTLDLNGHKIQGPFTGPPFAGSGRGINAENRYSITIKNGKVWGFGTEGIYLHSSSGDPSEKGAGNWVDRIQAANNGTDGITVYSGLVTNCTANNNGDDGIVALDSTIADSVAHNNNYSGFVLSGSIITKCSANHNGTYGIYALSKNRIEGNNLRYNGTYGLYLSGEKNYAIKNVATNSTSSNFYADPPGPNYMPVTVHNPTGTPPAECSGNDNCEF